MKRRKGGGYRKMKTTQEMRSYYDYPELVRAKRRPVNLPNTWDDKYVNSTKSWKGKRKRQYKNRGQKHSITIPVDSINEWRLKEWFEQRDISYNFEYIKEYYTYKRAIYSYREPTEKEKPFNKKYVSTIKFETIIRNGRKSTVVRTVKTWYGEYLKIEEFVGYKDQITSRNKEVVITWWSDKDIGIEYLLQRFKGHSWN